MEAVLRHWEPSPMVGYFANYRGWTHLMDKFFIHARKSRRNHGGRGELALGCINTCPVTSLSRVNSGRATP